jgi:hypothetical protein
VYSSEFQTQDLSRSQGIEEACESVASKCQFLQMKLTEADVIMEPSTCNLKCCFLEQEKMLRFDAKLRNTSIVYEHQPDFT